MANCKFSNELNRLCKSSSGSIDSIEKLDLFKSYIHIVRTVEKDLKKLLRKVNASEKDTCSFMCKCKRWKISSSFIS